MADGDEELSTDEHDRSDDPGVGELESRLSADEIRIRRNEQRLAASDKRFALEESLIRRNRRLGIAVGVLLLLTIAALVASFIAINRDIDSVARASPRDGSVGTSALQDGAVTAAKLAPGSVVGSAIAPGAVGAGAVAEGAVGASALAPGAVTARAVAAQSLTGETIDESTLGPVPRARDAADASALAGLPGARYVRGVEVVRATTAASTARLKGPVTATCPEGARAIAGGAAIDGSRDVAITASAPDDRSGWRADAAAIGRSTGPWRIVVTAVCVRGG